MINASSEFKQLNNEKGRKDYLEYADVTLKDGMILNLTNKDLWGGGMALEDAVSSDNSFDIGAAIINKCNLTINNIYDDFSDYIFDDAEVVTYVGLKLNDGTVEKLRKGTFAVTDPKYNGSIITLECLDNMRKFDRPYSESKLNYPATLNAIVQDACTICGVTLQTYDFPHDDFIVQSRPTDEAITFREIISWAAQISGGFCRCDVYGRLEIKWYNQAALENPELNTSKLHHITSNYSAPTVALDDVVITGVRVVEKNESEETQNELTTYQSGTDGYVVSIEDNELIKNGAGQTIVGWLGEKLIGFRFRKASTNHASDPTIEAGDVGILTDRKGTEYKIIVSSTKFSTGSSQNTVSAAETPARNSAARYSSMTKNYVEWRKSIQKEKIEREKALEEIGKRLESSQGVFTTVEEQENGGNIYYLHNKPTLQDSDMVWKMTAEAWGVSTSKDEDGNFIWNAGMTVDGDTIVRILTATGVNADWINTGTLLVKDKKGNAMFLADMGTGKVTIDAESISIGGQNIQDMISAQSQGITAILSNEFQTVAVDSDGNFDVFPDNVETKITVLRGTEDITDQCSYYITGFGAPARWNGETYTAKVYDLEADEGYVDIHATYMNVITITKRFTVSKLYAGESGVSYILESSETLIKIGKNDLFSTRSILFNAYYRSGGSVQREEYFGKFRIRETQNGNEWKTVYESSQPESSVTHYLYDILSDADGNILVTADGKALITNAKNISEIEVSLYDESFEHMIDLIRIPAVKDVKALDQQEVFNLLTNNGTAKGIYKIGNELYINASYLVTGILTDLVGKNYWNLETGDFSLSSTVTVGGQTVDKIAQDKVDSQTQEEVFNKLTNNGAIKGIILTNGQLYINASYIHSGTLTLGGLSNGNGVLNLLDEDNNRIVRLDYDGIKAIKGKIGSLYLTENGLVSDTSMSFSTGTPGDIFIGEYGIDTLLNGKGLYMSGNRILFGSTDSLTVHAGSIEPYIGTSAQGIGLEFKSSDTTNLIMYQNKSLFHGNVTVDNELYVQSALTVNGQKNRVVKTENFNDRLLYCVESASPIFSDCGEGMIDENGECIIEICPIFLETISTICEYQVFLQKEGQGDIWVDLKESTFFIVKGTENLKFAWEIKAKQIDYTLERIEDYDLTKKDIENFKQENILNEDLETEIYKLSKLEQSYQSEASQNEENINGVESYFEDLNVQSIREMQELERSLNYG